MKRIYFLTLMVFMVTTACGSEARVIPTITSTPTLTLDQMIPTPRYRNTIDTPTNTPAPTATDASVLLITSTPQILKRHEL
ncbi:MAG: hypothetical protein IPJ46_13565 [Anaerolineales bacterium]|nr:hypothetical protein [Anaerolineales bacterium]